MKRRALGISILFLSLIMLACGVSPTATPVPRTLTPLPTDSPTPTPAVTPSPTATDTPMLTVTSTRTPSPTATPSKTPTPTPTQTATSAPTPIPWTLAVDVLKLPGWDRSYSFVVVTHDHDGSLRARTLGETGWDVFIENKSACFTIKGDFEVQFGVVARDPKTGEVTSGRLDVSFSDRWSTGTGNPTRELLIGTNSKAQWISVSWAAANGQRGRVPEVSTMGSSSFRVRFEQATGDSAGNVTVYEADTGKRLGAGLWPSSEVLGGLCVEVILSKTTSESQTIEAVFSHLRLYTPPGTHNVSLP